MHRTHGALSRATTKLVTVALLAAGVFVVAGCGDSITMGEPSQVTDEGYLREFLDEDEIFDDLGPYGGTALAGDGGRDAIDPLTFWRRITDRECYREILFDPETGTAEVTVHRDVWGDLHIVDENMVEYVKPFHHEGIRYANFVRDPDWEPPGGQGGQGQGGQGQGDQGSNGGQGQINGHRHRRGPWVLTELSGFLARSETLTISIDWIRVQSATVDVTISDPLELKAVPDEILTLELGEEVTVTVSGPPEDAIVFLHTRHHKSPFQYSGGVFTGTWTVSRPGRHGAWVQAMAHDTIYDTDHPDDALIWGTPYFVAEGEIEE